MKFLRPTIGVFILGLLLAVNGYARPLKSGCDSLGRINNIFYTSCFPWQSSDGTITTGSSTVNNDTPRLKYLLESSSTIGKIIFDEEGYYINDSIILYGYRTVIGTGAGDATLSTDFEFTNLTFAALNKGIYVNAREYGNQPPGSNCQPNGIGCEGVWRFDNVKLDHAKFESCNIGVHVNSKNSGWSMSNLLFFVPAGNALPAAPAPTSQNPDPDVPPVVPDSSGNIGGIKLGVYLQRVGYSTLNELIADGAGTSSAFIYVGEHANLNIQSIIDEGFRNSVYVYGGDINSPITLTNNTIQSRLTVRNATLVSTGNQFSALASTTPFARDAQAIKSSKVYSIGDRFCLDYAAGSSTCTESLNPEGYQTDASSEVVFSSNRYRNTLFNLRFGVKPYQYDVARNVYNGLLEFKGEQTGGYAGYSFGTPAAAVKVNNDGSVTYASKNYTDLTTNANLVGGYPPPDGTVVYCSNCQKTTPCSTGGGGALAKRINGSWDCD